MTEVTVVRRLLYGSELMPSYRLRFTNSTLTENIVYI